MLATGGPIATRTSVVDARFAHPLRELFELVSGVDGSLRFVEQFAVFPLPDVGGLVPDDRQEHDVRTGRSGQLDRRPERCAARWVDGQQQRVQPRFVVHAGADDDDGRRNVGDGVFGDAPAHGASEPGARVGGDDEQVDVFGGCLAHDALAWIAAHHARRDREPVEDQAGGDAVEVESRAVVGRGRTLRVDDAQQVQFRAECVGKQARQR